jgi:hypothetical protein
VSSVRVIFREGDPGVRPRAIAPIVRLESPARAAAVSGTMDTALATVRRHTVLGILLFAVGCTSAGERDRRVDGGAVTVVLDSTTRTVLPNDLRAGSLRRCDRALPGGEGGRWTPSPELVRHIDSRLGAVLDSVLDRIASADPGLDLDATQYYRQYAGVTVRGRRLVHVNGFLPLEPVAGEATSDTIGWRTFPVAGCDAGLTRFGVVFDVADGEFGRLEFTDRLDGPVRY